MSALLLDTRPAFVDLKAARRVTQLVNNRITHPRDYYPAFLELLAENDIDEEDLIEVEGTYELLWNRATGEIN